MMVEWSGRAIAQTVDERLAHLNEGLFWLAIAQVRDICLAHWSETFWGWCCGALRRVQP
jgi:hypothetical protein